MVEKKGVVFSKRRSAQRVLWICSGLSTAWVAVNRFFYGNLLFRADRAGMSERLPVAPGPKRSRRMYCSPACARPSRFCQACTPPHHGHLIVHISFPVKPSNRNRSPCSHSRERKRSVFLFRCPVSVPPSPTPSASCFPAELERSTRRFLALGQEWPRAGFSHSACSICLIKRDIYKIVVVVNVAAYCG